MMRALLASYPAAILGLMFVLFLCNIIGSDATLNIYPDSEWFLGSSFNLSAILFLKEFFTKSWNAEINGWAAELYKVNGNQIDLPIGGATSFIELEYVPAIITQVSGFVISK